MGEPGLARDESRLDLGLPPGEPPVIPELRRGASPRRPTVGGDRPSSPPTLDAPRRPRGDSTTRGLESDASGPSTGSRTSARRRRPPRERPIAPRRAMVPRARRPPPHARPATASPASIASSAHNHNEPGVIGSSPNSGSTRLAACSSRYARCVRATWASATMRGVALGEVGGADGRCQGVARAGQQPRLHKQDHPVEHHVCGTIRDQTVAQCQARGEVADVARDPAANEVGPRGEVLAPARGDHRVIVQHRKGEHRLALREVFGSGHCRQRLEILVLSGPGVARAMVALLSTSDRSIQRAAATANGSAQPVRYLAGAAHQLAGRLATSYERVVHRHRHRGVQPHVRRGGRVVRRSAPRSAASTASTPWVVPCQARAAWASSLKPLRGSDNFPTRRMHEGSPSSTRRWPTRRRPAPGWGGRTTRATSRPAHLATGPAHRRRPHDRRRTREGSPAGDSDVVRGDHGIESTRLQSTSRLMQSIARARVIWPRATTTSLARSRVKGPEKAPSEPEDDPLLAIEKIVTPVDRGGQRLVAAVLVSRCLGQQLETMVELGGEHAAGAELTTTGGRQLDGERDPVESRADLGDRRGVGLVETRRCCRGHERAR